MERRGFLQSLAAVSAVAAPVGEAVAGPGYPRVFRGRQLPMIAFPLGGVAAGTLSLGGRGQLRDWEIFNKPDKGRAPRYAFSAIWARVGKDAPVVRVLESRLQPPYEASGGLGPGNVPGLKRFSGAAFRGEYPLATVNFQDARMPVKVSLEAFTPIFPLDAEESGLPVAILRYRVANPGPVEAEVGIVFSLQNPTGDEPPVERRNERVRSGDLEGLHMQCSGLPAGHAMNGSVALGVVRDGGKLTIQRGWEDVKWWASALLFWDEFGANGELGAEAARIGRTGSVCLKRTIAAGAQAEYTFVLGWHFPNRTPEGCGWGTDRTVIGNHYATRFRNAWEAAAYAVGNLTRLEGRMRQFLGAMRETTLPAVVKEAATANLSTLATQTCFRTADGRFRGFEGTHPASGCCFGSCTHVWNYEPATSFLYPALARSMREAAFEVSARMGGAMPIRVTLPEGKQKDGLSAADGTMGQILKVYLDWQLSGDSAWLRKLWPEVKRALEFAWIAGGWDADRDGVMEGVQHNTYDVEFYGPNPMCGIYYLGGLRAGEEMARAMGDQASAAQYRRLYERGRAWIDANLFNGEYYVQKITGIPKEKIAAAVRSGSGAEDSEHPDFQMGEGCLVDQLVGQYVADFCGLEALVDERHIRRTLESIYRYNYKRDLMEHDSVQRIFALNDEAALVICDYTGKTRPKVPFPYFAEVMTGFEYQAAALMLAHGMVAEGVECIGNIRRRYDGERRNPWDEAECGHHYARAMASWSAIVLLAGFRYDGVRGHLRVKPLWRPEGMKSFWSTASAWGVFSHSAGRVAISVRYGRLKLESFEAAGEGAASVVLAGRPVAHRMEGGVVRFESPLEVGEGSELIVTRRGRRRG
ncbi:MAG: GH116 family glycosyl-hydrolase [Acidobacteria bacterium]|nr:GH116 family glycosyl-hydrolase [Acidobacteriota bacterium]